ncbi:sporulation protein YqfD [Peribacillus sp. JNUCC 23]|uniref:sporulation protein YqfD n=1 Tax=Peribacillus sp. NPDC096379 TaxID=3364393 RepID=UPI00381CA1E3
MKNQWTNLYTGFVEVKASGKGTERLINELIRQGVSVWDIRRTAPGILVFCMDVQEISNLRKAVRKNECKVTFVKGSGGPFLIKRLIKNSGFVIGFLAFLITIFVLSNMVWGIKVHEASPDTEHAIRKELDKMGIKKGKLQFLLLDVDEIQKQLGDKIDVLTWVGVDLKGTTYHFQVVEKETPEEVKTYSPQHLVAKKKAVIKKMLVEKGKPIVNINDYVTKGQLLVSGLIGKEDKQQMVPAIGKIMGETWYKATVEVPLKTNFSVFNGDESTRHSIAVGSLSIPFWGFKNPDYPEYVTETSSKPFFFLQWKLPISYKTQTLRSKEDLVREYTKNEAVKEAKKMAKVSLEKELPEDAEIIGEKILRESIGNGKVILSIHYQVIENIAIGQPIIQGD